MTEAESDEISLRHPQAWGEEPELDEPERLPITANGFGAPSEGATSAWYRRRRLLPVFVAATVPDRPALRNSVAPPLQPMACWRLDDPRFDYDASFIKPEAAPEFTLFAQLWASLGGGSASAFGHADPTGADAYNKNLAGCRAAAVYGALVRDADLWERLYTSPPAGAHWGPPRLQVMLAALGQYDGPIDGVLGAGSIAGLKSVQAGAGLPPTGVADAATRKALFLAYMDFLCRDAAGAPFVMAREDFIGKGADPEGKGAYQSCGEFNPVLVFAKSEQAAYEAASNHDARNADNAPNRRVVVYVFRPGIQLATEQWPCPRAFEPKAGCNEYFWPDGEARRSPAPARREFAKTRDTFACAVYHRFAHRSPCEALRTQLRITLFSQSYKLMPNAPYRLWLGSDPHSAPPDRVGTANALGQVFESNVLYAGPVTVEWAAAGTAAGARYGYRAVYRPDVDEGSDEEQARTRLANLRYDALADTFEEQLGLFQDDRDLTGAGATRGTLDALTRETLWAVHDQGIPRP